MAERKFTRSLNKPGSAAQVRETVSQAVRESTLIVKPQIIEPVDFEIFFHKNKTLLQNDPLREMLLFPQDDIMEELLTSTHKHNSHLELLRQLAFEVMNDIPDQALIIYTVGSRSDTCRAGSSIFSNIDGYVKISIRNSDHCSIFRSELIAISGALDHALNSNKDSIWILTDSRSSIQYLKNLPKVMDSTGLDIISKLARLGQRKQVCLQRIPSHVGVPGNEAADEIWLAGVVIFLTRVPLS
ncbi:dedicator of cytokinesis protein 9 [Trichonephila clavipes]|nr:dedicator of cytokinesis protein 9 [Trichonephila clavipes]